MVGLFLVPIIVSFTLGEKAGFCRYADGADQYVDKAEGVTYERQWSVRADVPHPEMSTVRVQVSWRGTLADRAVTPLVRPPEVTLLAKPRPKPEVAL